MSQPVLHRPTRRWAGLVWGTAAMALSMLASVKWGWTQIDWTSLFTAYTTDTPTREQLVVQSTRVPRALIAASVGASLAMAGALMQALTRNPLASPGIFGINAGAAFFVVAATSFFTVSSLQSYTWIAFAGAAVAGLMVTLLGSSGRTGLTPIKLTLAGAAMTALFSTLTQGILVMDQRTLEEVLLWLSGSIVGRKVETLLSVLPFFAAAWILTLALSSPITTLVIGEDVAKGLGQRTAWVKAGAALCVVLLAGGAVAVAGPISLVGLLVPHIARILVGYDYRWVIPYCFVLGGTFLLLADIGARYLIMPGGPVMAWLTGTGAKVSVDEVPVGVITALLGVPFFITIARRSLSH
ncbi:FecCD family ABC transporter permease [Desmospora profundinema]|uniref:Iron complex transport system permease protein n=1 Tax=Desmospora profundinema TaxID=1571184 RepID=A0ABU1ILZ9_9BACL|nr:iron ABC transporter permease [Desmospora profundinema]MDR6225812.1 iron complex transport system permease protein [Desmospora profundinema]